MLKQYGGKRQTGFVKTANWNGVLHVWPWSVDLLTYIALPFPPWMALSNTTYATLPSWLVTMRASWSLRMLPLETFTGRPKECPASRDVEIQIGEFPPKPWNCAHVT